MPNVRSSALKPAFHEGRELELVLEGRKHLGFFFLETGIERSVFPEDQFDLHVANGLLVKDERIEEFVSPETGKMTSARNILCATAREAWRIPAMRMIQNIYKRMGPG